ncbi:Zinc-finger protein [Rhodovulum sp. P5]|nr:Zinc-finger protein [Rhodovulum sp. P5]
MLSGYLDVREHCPVCMEELHHHHSDDGPAYLTILIVGFLMAPPIVAAVMVFKPDPLVLTSIFSIGCVALALYLLPRLKGVMVALQWAKRMHGFGHRR